jgi:methylenetetrahydrofolate dehydrogenase (NADP+)/methenyltetrahydrofolate cyclohydrolase
MGNHALFSEFCTTKEAAAIMGYAHQSISRMCKTGKLQAEKFGSEYMIYRSAVKPLPYTEFNPDKLAAYHRTSVQLKVSANALKLRILGVLASGDEASKVYADYLVDACRSAGITLDLQGHSPALAQRAIEKANTDPAVHGIFVFYPIYGDARDADLKKLIAPHKDIEGLSPFWMNRLYDNKRFIDKAQTKKAVLPCTPLAILKSLEYVVLSLTPDIDARTAFKGKKITVFNRSDLVGKPLGYMLTNDGAEVYSFDEHGGKRLYKNSEKTAPIGRAQALRASDIVVTGVPSRAFEKVRGEEIQSKTICLNFSFVANFDNSAKEKAGVYVPRVGPMTIAMCLRNMIRLYENYSDQYPPAAAA